MNGVQGSGRPLVLMVSLGTRPYREYLLRAVSARYEIHAFLAAEPAWGREFLSGWTLLPSTLDAEAMIEAAARLDSEREIAGLLCFDEARILATAAVAESLGLRNGDPDVIRRMRDKGLTRERLALCGVAQPGSRVVRTAGEAFAAAESFGYPVIVKPRDLGASLGVVRVDDREQLASAFDFTWHARGPEAAALGADGSVLVEECVIGEEISIDSAVRDGRLTPLFVARKVVGYPPYAEEIGHYVDANDPLLRDPVIVDLLRDSHSALGARDMCTHTEIMLTSAGPKLIEVNGRPGGDVIPYLGELATGIDTGAIAAAVACGDVPDLTPSRSRVAGVRFFYPEHEDSTIVSIGFDLRGLPDAIDRLVPFDKIGAVLSPPPKGTWWGRLAYATAVADTFDECAQAIKAAESAIEVRTA